MLGRDEHGFVDISATTLNAAISGSILMFKLLITPHRSIQNVSGW
jgi:hypothetical protein